MLSYIEKEIVKDAVIEELKKFYDFIIEDDVTKDEIIENYQQLADNISKRIEEI